jgi:hypothetical protein
MALGYAHGSQWRDIVYLIAAAARAYLLCSCLAYRSSTVVEDRRDWMPDLLPLCLKAFAKAGGPQIDEDEAWFEMKVQSFSTKGAWQASSLNACVD